MSVPANNCYGGNSEILFFILIFLLLFYDNSPLYRYPYSGKTGGYDKHDNSILFFILIFLLLFYDNGAYIGDC